MPCSTNNSVPGSAGKWNFPGLILWLAIPAGLILSVTALIKICSSCSETANYRIFDQDFGWFGIGFFVLISCLLFARKRSACLGWLMTSLLFAAAGAEARFIWIQKYDIGQWCPICLGLAAAVFIACCAASWEQLRILTSKGATMKSIMARLILLPLFFALGLGAALSGVKKEADAAELDMYLGKTSSKTTVYFVSDWFCPACRKAEPVIEKMYPELAKSARVGFIDYPIHRETTNFTPFNLQFLMNEKAKYISLRKALADLSQKTKTPSEAEVQAAIAPLGVKLKPLNYSDTTYGLQANLMIYRGYNVRFTPTVVVANDKTKKSKLLVGEDHITLPAIRAAITEVEKR